MLTIYGSPLCPDCRECKANLDAHGVEYEYIDINRSMRNLKAFLKLRDSLPVFDVCKETGSVGIPALVLEDGTVTLMSKDVGLEPRPDNYGASCRIDGSGC